MEGGLGADKGFERLKVIGLKRLMVETVSELCPCLDDGSSRGGRRGNCGTTITISPKIVF